MSEEIQEMIEEATQHDPEGMDANLYWVAVYDDETQLRQYEDLPAIEPGARRGEVENAYGDINRNKLTEFHMVAKETHETVFAITIDEGERLVYRKRRSMGMDNVVNWTVYLVGWQKTVKGENVQSLNWIFPNRSIINTGKYNENHPVFYSVEFLPQETVKE